MRYGCDFLTETAVQAGTNLLFLLQMVTSIKLSKGHRSTHPVRSPHQKSEIRIRQLSCQSRPTPTQLTARRPSAVQARTRTLLPLWPALGSSSFLWPLWLLLSGVATWTVSRVSQLPCVCGFKFKSPIGARFAGFTEWCQVDDSKV